MTKREFAISLTAVVALLVLTLVLPVVDTSPAQASPQAPRWTRYSLPTEENFVLAPGSDVGPGDIASDDRTLFLALSQGDWGKADTKYKVLKSTDGGYKWEETGFSWTGEEIVAITISPKYDVDSTLFVATKKHLYMSDDGGDEFNKEWAPEDGGNITCLDVAAVGRERPLLVGTDRQLYFSEDNLRLLAQEDFNFAVLAARFSPEFNVDDTIVVVAPASDGAEVIFGQYDDKATTGQGLERDKPALGTTISLGTVAETACIGLPYDFKTTDLGSCRLFVACAPVSSATKYGITMISKLTETGTPSKAGRAPTTGEPILSIGVWGSIEYPGSMRIVAGSASRARAYWSTNFGYTWQTVEEHPTGEYNTRVFLAPDFGDNKVAYAATCGRNSALSCCGEAGGSLAKGNYGKRWNQISLIDAEIGRISSLAASANYHLDETLYMVTQQGQDGSLWKTVTGGELWERIWFKANPGLLSVKLADDGSLFVCQTGDKIYRSRDRGNTFSYSLIAEADIAGDTAWTAINATTLITGDVEGNIYATVDEGDTWRQGKIKDAVNQIMVKGSTVLVGSAKGKVFICPDYRADPEEDLVFVRLGGRELETSGEMSVCFDLNYGTNRLVYAGSRKEGEGIWRCPVNLAGNITAPEESRWEQIDDLSGISVAGMMVLPGGVLYAGDTQAVVVDSDPAHRRGGSRRIANPADKDVGKIVAQSMVEGLAEGDELGFLVARAADSNLLFAVKTVEERIRLEMPELWTLEHALAERPLLVEPANGSVQAGTIYEGETKAEVALTWERVKGTDAYELQVARDRGFSMLEGIAPTTSGERMLELLARLLKERKEIDLPTFSARTVEGTSVRMALDPGVTYYWRVRVAEPVFSPWSETWSFTTLLGPGVSRPELTTPYGGVLQGGVDAPIRPVFQWTSVAGAEGYKLQISRSADFSAIDDIEVITLAGQTAWQCDRDLDYGTTWFWRVKAFSPSESPWSSVGSFTTIPRPPATSETPPSWVVEVPPPAPPAPSAPAAPPPIPSWVWVSVWIGGVLIIALVILISRVRRL